jgi:phosphatidate cytidylyltransferase
LSELTKRILFAVPAAAIFIVLAWLGGIYFNAIMAVLAAGTLWEVGRLLEKSGHGVHMQISFLLAAIVWIAEKLPELALVVIGIAVVIGTATGLVGSYPWSQKWINTLFCGLYTTLGYKMAAEVRDLGVGQEGFWLILALFLMIWGNDVFAYFGGKTFGRRKLAPKISPNKTWEGFGSGILGACIGAGIAWIAVEQFPITISELMPAALIVSITGPIGDLLESSMKRRADMKDSSSLIPGHGGLFDRFDALILTAPFIYFYFTLFV